MNRIKWTKEDFMTAIQDRVSPLDKNRNGIPDALEMMNQLMTEAQIQDGNLPNEVMNQ